MPAVSFLMNPKNFSSVYEDLLACIQDNSAVIGIIGMGYVGLPLAITFAESGFVVFGFDINPEKAGILNAGKSYINSISSNRIGSQVESGNFSATSDYDQLNEVDIIIICVPTPLKQNRVPDLSYIEATAVSIVPHLKKGHLVILSSTTYPGCTRMVLKPLLEQSTKKSGLDFYLAYAPEREDPGNSDFQTAQIPKIIGGDTPDALRIAEALFDKIVVKTVSVSSIDVAEAVKLTENIFRSINIALVNELKVIYRNLDINIWEVIEAASTKPFGYMPFYPGPGLGGHCIPIDPFYLTWRANEVGESTRFIELAGEINTTMPEKVISSLENSNFDLNGLLLSDSSVLVLGIAYKKNIDDTRESPALKIIELLQKRGATVEFYDPYIAKIPITRDYPDLAGKESIEWSRELIAEFDAVLICTDHDNIDFELVSKNASLIIDTRNVFKDKKIYSSTIIQA